MYMKCLNIFQEKNDKEHFGLGLWIAYEIITLNKGKLSVMDTIGGGTTFIIVLGA